MGYLDEAQTRAKRRKSLWNLLLIPAVCTAWGLLTCLFYLMLRGLHTVLHGSQPLLSSEAVGPTLTVLGALFAALPFGFLGGNILVSLVPAARAALEREAAPVPGTCFREAQGGLLKVAPYISIPAALVGLFGALLSWS